jgi:hypothetical protein
VNDVTAGKNPVKEQRVKERNTPDRPVELVTDETAESEIINVIAEDAMVIDMGVEDAHGPIEPLCDTVMELPQLSECDTWAIRLMMTQSPNVCTNDLAQRIMLTNALKVRFLCAREKTQLEIANVTWAS